MFLSHRNVMEGVGKAGMFYCLDINYSQNLSSEESFLIVFSSCKSPNVLYFKIKVCGLIGWWFCSQSKIFSSGLSNPN